MSNRSFLSLSFWLLSIKWFSMSTQLYFTIHSSCSISRVYSIDTLIALGNSILLLIISVLQHNTPMLRNKSITLAVLILNIIFCICITLLAKYILADFHWQKYKNQGADIQFKSKLHQKAKIIDSLFRKQIFYTFVKLDVFMTIAFTISHVLFVYEDFTLPYFSIAMYAFCKFCIQFMAALSVRLFSI
jgi:hypothetical protein